MDDVGPDPKLDAFDPDRRRHLQPQCAAVTADPDDIAHGAGFDLLARATGRGLGVAQEKRAAPGQVETEVDEGARPGGAVGMAAADRFENRGAAVLGGAEDVGAVPA
nr:hypothetical protein [Acidimangrovimonas sediminis]